MTDDGALLLVFGAALLTAIATGLGALPFLFLRQIRRRALALANAMAVGLMLAASGTLIVEGVLQSPLRTALGFLLGWLLIRSSRAALVDRATLAFGRLSGGDARKALLIVGVMTLHSFAEGVGVGVAFADGEKLGVFITTAIALHNVPEGLAISLVLVPRGVSVWHAAWWSIFSSLPQPLMAVPAFLFVTWFEPLLPVGFGLAAGAMLWMSFAELMPEAQGELRRARLLLAMLVSAAAMILFQEMVLR